MRCEARGRVVAVIRLASPLPFSGPENPGYSWRGAPADALMTGGRRGTGTPRYYNALLLVNLLLLLLQVEIATDAELLHVDVVAGYNDTAEDAELLRSYVATDAAWYVGDAYGLLHDNPSDVEVRQKRQDAQRQDASFRKQIPCAYVALRDPGSVVLSYDSSNVGGICWSSISNGRCKELLSQAVTQQECCASNAAAATAYSEDDLDSGALFFWRVLGGGVPCRPCRESCAEVRCEEGKKCVVRKGRPRCVCSPECKAPRGGGPVCGTDGRSYRSLCRLKKRACKKGSHELAVAYNGHCQSSCARVRCGQGRSCLLDQNLSPHCVRCARRCPQASHQVAGVRPVCGADGNTYKSACHLRLAACRAGRAIPVAYKGHCKESADCTTIRCREGQTCLTEMGSGHPRCVTCTYRCPRKRERNRERNRDRDRDRDPSTSLLCASNNITYPSWCHIVKDACVTGFVLETRHAGPCNAYDAPFYVEENNTSTSYGVDLADEVTKIKDIGLTRKLRMRRSLT